MKIFSLSSTFLFVLFLNVSGQTRFDYLKGNLLSADSIMIVSHESTSGISLVDDKTGKHLPLPKLIVNGRLNGKIIHEKTNLKDTAIQRLTAIITRPFQDSVIERGMCFIPHHAVVFFRKGKASFIDICFGCRRIETSRDIKITADDFDNRKWDELIAFFKHYNFKYELEFQQVSSDE